MNVKPYLVSPTLTAGQIHILTHHYIMGEPYPYPSQFYTDTIARFRANGMLDQENEITAVGRALVERLMSVALFEKPKGGQTYAKPHHWYEQEK